MGSTKELYSIREWSPLNLNEQIPACISRGFFANTVKFTCLDAIEEFLAIGSDVGVVFWYNRHTGETQKLRAEVASRITCVKIVDSVEYMIAAGSANGCVSVFQIQKQIPEDLNLIAPCTRAKPIERYTIRDLHRMPVSCCVWSKNGMKLYSGDRQGIVVLTEFDYQAHLSKSIEILCEAFEIVQLSVHQCYLLVSTLYRAVICQRHASTGVWNITQIGKKDRKQLIDCGGIFIKRSNAKQPQIISGRPGLRFWLADTEGNVEKTLLFREAVARSPIWEIPILNPKLIQLTKKMETSVKMENDTQTNNNFRNFYTYAGQDTLIVTHDEINLYILNLDRLRVEAIARGFRKIMGFCVCNKEIFVLEGDRSVLRLAPLPEKPNKMAQIIFNPLMPPPVPLLGAAAAAGHFEAPVEYEPEERTIVNAEECFELPPIETLNLDIPIELAVESPRSEQSRRLQIFNQISEQNFEESILHQSGHLINGRKKRKSKSSERKRELKIEGIVEIGHMAQASEEEMEVKQPATQKTTQPTLMAASYCQPIKNETEKTNDELSLPHLTPIAAEELERAQALANLAPLQLNTTTTPLTFGLPSFKSPTLKLEYPKQHSPQLEDAQVQTTPPKKIYYIQQQQKKSKNQKEQQTPQKQERSEEQQQQQETLLESTECGDYSAGQPVDEISLILRATNLIEINDDDENDEIKKERCLQKQEKVQQQQTESQLPQQLQFVAVKPASLEGVNSFLPDFRRIRDPMLKSPPPSGGSATSSEWEFLDN